MLYVNGVFRYSPFGEIITNKFDAENGYFCKMENWLQIDTSLGLEYRMSTETTSNYMLKTAMLRLPNSLAIIDYMGRGFITINADRARLYSWRTFLPKQEVRLIHPISEIRKEIGVVRTIATTFNYRQLPYHIAIGVNDSNKVIHTTKGVLDVAFEYDEIDEINYKHYLELVKIKEAYGYVTYKGNPVFLGIKDNKIIRL